MPRTFADILRAQHAKRVAARSTEALEAALVAIGVLNFEAAREVLRSIPPEAAEYPAARRLLAKLGDGDEPGGGGDA